MTSNWVLIILFVAVLTLLCLAVLLIIIRLYYWGPSGKPIKYRHHGDGPRGSPDADRRQ
jgi:hypothetical protein